MTIHMYKFYKNSIICFATISLLIIIGALIFTAYYQTGDSADFIMLFAAVPIAVLIALFPIFLNYKHLTQIRLYENTCIAYSFLRKKLCTVDFEKQVYYSVFYVRFAYAPQVEFIAVSNAPFTVEQNGNTFSKRGFYGAYNQKRIIVFPYDAQVASLLHLEKWEPIKQNPFI